MIFVNVCFSVKIRQNLGLVKPKSRVETGISKIKRKMDDIKNMRMLAKKNVGKSKRKLVLEH